MKFNPVQNVIEGKFDEQTISFLYTHSDPDSIIHNVIKLAGKDASPQLVRQGSWWQFRKEEGNHE